MGIVCNTVRSLAHLNSRSLFLIDEDGQVQLDVLLFSFCGTYVDLLFGSCLRGTGTGANGCTSNMQVSATMALE